MAPPTGAAGLTQPHLTALGYPGGPASTGAPSARGGRTMTQRSVARLMRWTVVLACVAVAGLAGCAAPTNKTASSPLLGLCPQWVQGLGGTSVEAHLVGDDNETHELGPADATFQGRPLDLYRLHVDRLAVQGRLELRAFAADGRQ